MVSQETETIIRAGKRLYDERLRSDLESNHLGEFVAIEPTSGEYFLGRTLSEAIQAARRAHPDRLPCTLRIGERATVHIGIWT